MDYIAKRIPEKYVGIFITVIAVVFVCGLNAHFLPIAYKTYTKV